MKKRICVLTGTRAEYGLLSWLIKAIHDDPDLELQLVVTGMHLSPAFGSTYRVIEEDGFVITDKVEMLLAGDTPLSVAKSMGIGVMGLADVFDRLKPDWLIVLGDRFELLAAVQAALILKVPVAHINGGDVTLGAFDESIRHSLTKMAHVHFVSSERARHRIRQMGEDPNTIHNVGFLGLDNIKRMVFLSQKEVEERLQFKFHDKNILITFHPITLDTVSSTVQVGEVLQALSRLGKEYGLIFTKTNADPEGQRINQLIEEFVKGHDNAVVHVSLGQELYLSTLKCVDLILGNSSSGIFEAPFLQTPTVNVGDREKGREQVSSVINCEPTQSDILRAIKEAHAVDTKKIVSPFVGEGSLGVLRVLKGIKDPKTLLKKRFYDL